MIFDSLRLSPGRRSKLLVLALVVAGACMQGRTPPEVPAHGTLKPAGPNAPRPDDAAFRVVWSAPEGRAVGPSELSIVFSRPLRALDRDVPPPPLVMRPELGGKWLWVGSRALRFVPESHGALPGATRVEVEVPASTRALDGSTLGAPHRFAFETPRPKLASFSPRGKGHTPDAAFDLFFNQPVEPAEVERHLVLSAVKGDKSKAIPFRIVRPDPADAKRLRVTPRAALPLASSIRGVLAPGIRSNEGPLASDEAGEFDLSTYGPLRVERAACWEEAGLCPPGSSPYIEFSNPVRWSELRRALSVVPAGKLRWESWQVEDEFTSSLTVPADFAPGRAYTVRLAGDLSDRFGQKLGTPLTKTFHFADLGPMVDIGIEGQNLPSGGASKIPIGAVNVPGYELLLASLRPADVLAFLEADETGGKLAVLSKSPGARKSHVSAGGPKNRIARHEVDLATLLPGGRGAAAIGVRSALRGEDHELARIVKTSDLGITAKVGSEGSVVWVTRLSSGEPVRDAEVEIQRHGQAARRYRADAHGLVAIPRGDMAFKTDGYEFQENMLVVAKSGADWTYEALTDHVPAWRLPVAADFTPQDRVYGMLFTDRGVYRPGDEVKVKGIVRAEVRGGNAVVARRQLDVTLSSPSGETVTKQRVTTGEFGTFSLSVRVPASVELGSFQLSAAPLNSPASMRESFQVAEYQPNEFSVAAEALEKSYLRGQTARFEAHGDYLFGAPMAGAAARFTLVRQPGTFSVPAHEGYSVDAGIFYADRDHAALGYGELATSEGKLDASGRFAIEHVVSLPGQRGPETILASVEVTDAGRRVVAAETSALVHPAEFYIGIENPKDSFFSAPTTLSPRVLALSPRGERFAGRRVRLELVNRRWTLAREVGDGRAAHAVSRPVDRVVSHCELTTASEPRGCKLEAKQGGYFLVVARSTDARKNPIETAIGMYALGAGEGGWGDDDRARVELVANKRSYQVGETARLLVKSPFPEAEALVTVERAGVYRAEHIKLRGALPTVSIPITEDLRPNAYVAVHLLRARGPGKKEQTVGPSYRMGYASLAIDAEARRLKVAVRPTRKQFRPGDSVQVDLSVTDANGAGRAAELAVFAVDEGALALTGYRTPDPLPVFSAPRPLAVATLETREALARIGLENLESALGLDKGKDGGGGGEGSARSDFRQTAFFDPAVLTDERGRATVRFKLPDSLTTYRVMAVAVGKDDRYGFGSEQVTASKALMARPALPRFLRAGDVLDAGVIVSKKELAAGKVRVQVSAEGLSIEGPAAREVEVERNASIEVRFRFRAARAGMAKFSFKLEGAGQSDLVQVERRIDLPQALEAVALYGETRESAAEKLGALADVDPVAGGLEVQLSSTALVGLESSMQTLIDYPYGCTEQLASRLLPLVPLRELARDFGLPLPPNADLAAERIVGEILTRQRDDGGFGFWPGAPQSSAWLSAYTLWVLDEAARRKARVPRTVLTRGRAYLREELGRSFERDPAAMAFVVDVLAVLGAPDQGFMTRLFEQRQKLPLFSQGFLLHALALGKARPADVRALEREVSNQLRITGEAAYVSENLGSEYAPLMDSPTRTSAIVLRALLASDPQHPLLTPLARGLLAVRRGGAYRNTQETAFALLALDGYRRAREKEPPSFEAKVRLGARELLAWSSHGRSVQPKRASLKMTDLRAASGAALFFEKDGSGTLFYEARLRYAPRTLPRVAIDSGFFVQKTLRTISPEELGSLTSSTADTTSSSFRAGDLVVADIFLVTPSAREYVVLDDPLPAGFEAIDTSLRTTASVFADAEGGYGSGRDGDGGYGSARAPYRRELRDDRALFFAEHLPAGLYHYRYFARATSAGRFIVPPTKAEGMYEPETFGRTAASIVEVR